MPDFSPDSTGNHTDAKPERVEQTPVGESFEDLYHRYNRLVFSRFRIHGFDKEDARDLLQKTFLAAFSGWESFRGDASFKTWLLAIADRKALATFRDQGRLKRQGDVFSIDEPYPSEDRYVQAHLQAENADDPEKELLTAERSQLLHSALKQLPPQMRQIAILRFRNEFKYQEIADVLKISLGTVRSELYGARQRLKSLLAEAMDDKEAPPE